MNRNDMIELIKNFPAKITELVTNLSENQLDTPYGEGKWTVREVIHHLADSHMNGYARMKWILTENNPELKPYDQDKWTELADSKLPITISLLILKGLHDRMAYLLENLLEDDWKRTAYHAEEGDLSMAWMLEAYSNHGEKHYGHIKSLLDRMGWK
ncbi:YfiT family bacillithiol transferase [Candidatus Zixiibacteriota bacterium]